MGQSFYTSIGGIKAAQSQINVVSDNLANLNTVGFKESRVTFSDVYYTTLSAGSRATSSYGGTNPKQIGLGTQVSSIGRNFENGSTQTTGLSTDMNVQGDGFFCVLNQNNQILYTRAGNFSLDSDGNLTMPNGCKVMGTASTFSTQGGTTTIKLPPLITTQTLPNEGVMDTKELSELNNVDITTGDFSITIDDGTTAVTTTVSIDSTDNLSDICTSIENKINSVTGGSCSVDIEDGKIKITGIGAGTTLAFAQGSSNFPSATELNLSPEAGPYETKVLDYKQVVTVPDSSASAVKYAGMEVYENGTIEVKYSNGDKLSVSQDENNKTVFKYTTSDGIEIVGDDAQVSTALATPANLQIELASFINSNGLVAEGGNTYSAGANCGAVFYGTPSSNGFGSMQTGALESSNVDMTKQFADMIIAQRAIEANSRVFDTQNQVMKTLVYLGQ